MNYVTYFRLRICIKISGTVVIEIPRSVCIFHIVSRQSLLIATHTCSTFSGVLLVAGLPECGSLSTDSQPFVPHCYLCCTHCIIPQNLLNHTNSFHRGIFKLNTKSNADSLLYLLSYFEYDGHTVHMLTQHIYLLH